MTSYAKTALLVLLLSGSGCSRHQTGHQPMADAAQVSRQYRKGAITLILSVSQTNITTTGNIQLTVDVQAPEGTSVSFPDIGKSAEPFSVFDSLTEPLQTLSNGKQLHRQVWWLAPGMPGDVILQPLSITAGTTMLETEPIPLHVESILPPGLSDLEIKDIAAPASRLAGKRHRQYLWMALLLSVIVIALAGMGIRLRRKTRVLPSLEPYEAALLALENLPDENLARIDQLNHILREYIEHRFNLPIIGKTPQEISAIIANTNINGLTPQSVEFMEAGEQIRFSNIMPNGFAEDTEQFIRGFIESTKEEDVCA